MALHDHRKSPTLLLTSRFRFDSIYALLKPIHLGGKCTIEKLVLEYFGVCENWKALEAGTFLDFWHDGKWDQGTVLTTTSGDSHDALCCVPGIVPSSEAVVHPAALDRILHYIIGNEACVDWSGAHNHGWTVGEEVYAQKTTKRNSPFSKALVIKASIEKYNVIADRYDVQFTDAKIIRKNVSYSDLYPYNPDECGNGQSTLTTKAVTQTAPKNKLKNRGRGGRKPSGVHHAGVRHGRRFQTVDPSNAIEDFSV